MNEVVLIGDSVRMGYQGFVSRRLEGTATVWAPEANSGNSRNVLAYLEEWVFARDPGLVHVNCGLHDIRREFDARVPAVPLPEYRRNVERVLRRIVDRTDARVIWATTTPVNEAWHRAVKGFDRFEADVADYNAAAAEVCHRLDAAVNDLFDVVMAAGRDRLLSPDGVHFTDEGCALLGRAVADAMRAHL